MLTALAAGLRCALAILRKVAWIVLCAAAAAAALTAPAPRLCRPLTIIGEIARAMPAANMAGARRLLTILGKIARIAVPTS